MKRVRYMISVSEECTKRSGCDNSYSKDVKDDQTNREELQYKNLHAPTITQEDVSVPEKLKFSLLLDRPNNVSLEGCHVP